MNQDTRSLLELRKFVAPEFIFGLGARKLVGRYAKNCGARKVLLVTDKFLREHTLWIQEMRQLLTAARHKFANNLVANAVKHLLPT